jgi:hypothetical protein
MLLKAGDHLQHIEDVNVKVAMLKLQNVSELARLDSLEGLKELEVIKELMDEEHAVVIRERIHDQRRRHDEEEHQRVFVIDGGEGNIVIDENRQVKHLKIGRDNIVLKGHLDAI